MLNRIVALVLSLMLMCGAASANHLTLAGEVFYRERLALPPGATLHVGLVSLPSGAPVVGAGASIPTNGQVPLQFSLAIRSDVATSKGSFGLVAEIRVGAGVLFRNAVAVPVDLTAPAPTSILVTRQPLPPQPAEPQVDTELVGAIWTVTSIGGSPTTGTQPLTLSIAPDLRAGGSAGCNNYFTQATIDRATLTFGLPAATRKICAPDLMDQERAFFAALAATASYEMSANSLRLLDAAGIPLIGLVEPKE